MVTLETVRNVQYVTSDIFLCLELHNSLISNLYNYLYTSLKMTANSKISAKNLVKILAIMLAPFDSTQYTSSPYKIYGLHPFCEVSLL